jgi:hypothetical protein
MFFAMLDPILPATFWQEALAAAGHTDIAVHRQWRGRRYDYALLRVGRLRWLGSAAIAAQPERFEEVSTPQRCANEAAALGRLASGGHELGVLSPALLAHGTHAGRAFVVRQWIEGRAGSSDEDELAAVCERLRRYRTPPLPRDYVERWHTGRRPGLNHRIEQVEAWAGELAAEIDLSRLLARVREPPGGIQLGFSHGDFVPANLIRNADGLWLVDFENACAQRAEYYDAAWCYYVLRTQPGPLSPGSFAVSFRQRLRFGERRGFRQAFRWHLATLLVGGYRAHFLDGGEPARLNLDLLTADVLRGKLPA